MPASQPSAPAAPSTGVSLFPLDPEVLVVGAGVGGITAAVAAAREGARVLLIEKTSEIGGTGVHAYPGLITRHWADDGRYVNDGLHRRFFPESYAPGVEAVLKLWGAEKDAEKRKALNWLTPLPCYEAEALNARYRQAIAEQPTLRVEVETTLRDIRVEQGRIVSATLVASGGARRTIRPSVVVDATFNGDIAAAAGAKFAIGEAGDGVLQPGTLIFTLDNVDFSRFDLKGWPLTSVRAYMLMCEELNPLYHELRTSGGTSNPRPNVLMFVRPDLRSALMNQTRVFGVDPNDPDGIAKAKETARRQVQEFVEGMRLRHPAFHHVRLGQIATRLGIRDGRRIIGDHVLTGEECVKGERFPDMIAACANFIDIHATRKDRSDIGRDIGNNGYFHIPYRCLTPVGLHNVLVASRAISCDFEAHGATRVLAPICAYAEAAGIAASMTAAGAGDTRSVSVAALQRRLRDHGQFVECVGPVLAPTPAAG